MPSTLSILTNVFPAGGARPRDRDLGRRLRARDRDRAGERRLPARALLVGRGLPRQRARSSSLALVAAREARARLARPRDAAARPARRRALRGRRSRRSCGRSSRRRRAAGRARSILGSFAPAAGIAAAFAVHELRTAHPMLDVRLFRNRRFSGASGSVALVFFALMGAIFFLTQYLQSVLGYSPLQAGVRVVPIALGLIAGAGLSTRLDAKLGTKVVVAGGLTILSAALGAALDGAGRLGLRADRRRARADGPRHGLRDGARDRLGDGRAAAREGERRLGDERHDADGRRRARRRGARQHPLERLPRRRRRDRPAARPPPPRPATRWAARCTCAGGHGPLVVSAQHAFVSGMSTASLVAAGDRARRRALRARVPARPRALRVEPLAAGAGGARDRARPRGRPRLAETDAAILRATLELLADEGLRGLGVRAGRGPRRRREDDGLPSLRDEAGACRGRARDAGVGRRRAARHRHGQRARRPAGAGPPSRRAPSPRRAGTCSCPASSSSRPPIPGCTR